MSTSPLPPEIEILFVAGFGPIVSDGAASRHLYAETLGIELESHVPGGDYLYNHTLAGVKHFALWPLSHAAESCFGTPQWPQEHPVPQAWLEFDVADIERASAALERAGYTLLVRCRQEPWGQTVTRFLSPENILTALTHTPELR